jgi:hypothetical protein
MSWFLLVPTHCNRCIVQVRRTRDMYRTFFYFSCMLIKTRSEYFISRHLQIASLRCNSRERSIDNTIYDLLFSIQNLSTKCVPHRVFPQKIPHPYFVQLQQSPKISPRPVFVSLISTKMYYICLSHMSQKCGDIWRAAELDWGGRAPPRREREHGRVMSTIFLTYPPFWVRKRRWGDCRNGSKLLSE